MSDKQEQVIIVKNQTNFGLWGVIVGFVGIFVFSIVLSPLAFILGLVGIINGKIVSGIFAILFAILGLITSPIVMGILGLGALIAIPGLY
tara:strand:- start:167 stop:436 length:270 start_codon:yes stop_codon:yes gene_type:complete